MFFSVAENVLTISIIVVSVIVLISIVGINIYVSKLRKKMDIEDIEKYENKLIDNTNEVTDIQNIDIQDEEEILQMKSIFDQQELQNDIPEDDYLGENYLTDLKDNLKISEENLKPSSKIINVEEIISEKNLKSDNQLEFDLKLDSEVEEITIFETSKETNTIIEKTINIKK